MVMVEAGRGGEGQELCEFLCKDLRGCFADLGVREHLI